MVTQHVGPRKGSVHLERWLHRDPCSMSPQALSRGIVTRRRSNRSTCGGPYLCATCLEWKYARAFISCRMISLTAFSVRAHPRFCASTRRWSSSPPSQVLRTRGSQANQRTQQGNADFTQLLSSKYHRWYLSEKLPASAAEVPILTPLQCTRCGSRRRPQKSL